MRLIDADKFESYIDCGRLRPPAEVCFSECDVINMIRKQPTIDPEDLRPKGKWNGYNGDKKYWQRFDGSPIFMSCSNCNNFILNNGSAHWNYCPNCGAKMVVEE